MNDAPPNVSSSTPLVPPQMLLQPPVFGLQPAQKKPKAKSTTPSALSPEMAANPTNTGQKQLVGQ